MTEQPLVSVIIPNYNHAPYLKERVDSVLNQTYQNFEVIILDDCSTDDSREVIEYYRNHSKVKEIIFNDVNSGSTFKQWKKGIDLAKGEWIWIAESDDWCEVIFLETLLKSICKYKNIGLAYCQSLFVNVLDNKLNSYRSTENVEEFIEGKEFLEMKMIPYLTLINASMAIFRKELYYKISSEYTTFKLAGDWVFWVEISRHCNVVINGKFLNYFRQHPIKVSINTKKNGQNYIEELKALTYFKNNFSLDESCYDEAVLKHYFRFKYDKFPFNEGVVEQTERLFRSSFSEKNKRKVKRKIFEDKVYYKLLPKLFKMFSKV